MGTVEFLPCLSGLLRRQLLLHPFWGIIGLALQNGVVWLRILIDGA